MQPQLNTLKVLLGILNKALYYEQHETNGLGAAVAQQVLSVTEPVLQEMSSQQRVIVRSISEEVCLIIALRLFWVANFEAQIIHSNFLEITAVLVKAFIW